MKSKYGAGFKNTFQNENLVPSHFGEIAFVKTPEKSFLIDLFELSDKPKQSKYQRVIVKDKK